MLLHSLSLSGVAMWPGSGQVVPGRGLVVRSGHTSPPGRRTRPALGTVGPATYLPFGMVAREKVLGWILVAPPFVSDSSTARARSSVAGGRSSAADGVTSGSLPLSATAPVIHSQVRGALVGLRFERGKFERSQRNCLYATYVSIAHIVINPMAVPVPTV